MIRRLLNHAHQAQYGTLFFELVVVVIGILFALSIDDWRQEREELEHEHEYLVAIKADLQEDLRMFDERIFPEIKMRLEKSKQLGQVTPESVPESLEAQRMFVDDIGRAGFMNTYRPRRNAMDDMLATGNLRLLSNRQLRLDLLGYYDKVEQMQPYDDWGRKLIWENFRNEFTGFIPLDAVHMRAQNREAAPRESFVAIVQNEIFQRGLLNVRGMAEWQQQRYKGIYDEVSRLIEIVDEEISRK